MPVPQLLSPTWGWGFVESLAPRVRVSANGSAPKWQEFPQESGTGSRVPGTPWGEGGGPIQGVTARVGGLVGCVITAYGEEWVGGGIRGCTARGSGWVVAVLPQWVGLGALFGDTLPMAGWGRIGELWGAAMLWSGMGRVHCWVQHCQR